ncbi:MAG: 1-(5-phosphoribosyl)-5-[(5-phosphoribosylamino)methylideneamino]imidazole-4-carboxamide isomerase [Coriobacteriales bacterium]|jgi:phosphoribosylformimino-5-aminoimidazole carboxamide ribotide isomerase|nr:1-(5-phosphoribosyl)-5-[(5-phosphoribosylamino)methylideneamino]imidazole-4-carboxamide isomerase [Coriobacteriales bacterium]
MTTASTSEMATALASEMATASTSDRLSATVRLYPAIDLLGGKVVRLSRGDYQKVTVYHDDPLAQAEAFAREGADWLHVVDLDAARGAESGNRDLIIRIIAESGLPVQTGGGIRSLQAVEQLAQAGAARVILGTSLIADKALVKSAVDSYGDLICAAIDARNGKVAIDGWQKTSGINALDLARELAELGICHFLYTDINRDGLQTGIDIEAYRQMAEAVNKPVIVSGGVASLDDLHAVMSIADSVEAVIAGRALYEKNFTIREALAVLKAVA